MFIALDTVNKKLVQLTTDQNLPTRFIPYKHFSERQKRLALTTVVNPSGEVLHHLRTAGQTPANQAYLQTWAECLKTSSHPDLITLKQRYADIEAEIELGKTSTEALDVHPDELKIQLTGGIIE